MVALLHNSETHSESRRVVLLKDSGDKYGALEKCLQAALSGILPLSFSELSDETREERYSNIYKEIIGAGVRHAHFIACGRSTVILQMLAVRHRKLARSLTLVDPLLRPFPTRRERMMASLERALPLGLPFRSLTKGYDSSSSLHRIRMPCLLVLTSQASPFIRTQCNLLSQYLPLSWQLRYTASINFAELEEAIVLLSKVPLKCPQKLR
jgi:hypothetical protein